MASSTISTPKSAPRNRLLAAVPAAEFQRLSRDLEPVELKIRDILWPAGAAIKHVYFVEKGLVSLVQVMDDGAQVEVGLIGREGFLGVPLVLGARTSTTEANVQLEGAALRMTAKAFQEAARRSEKLRTLFLSYAHALHIQITQTAACNNRHDVQQRLARWLLSARDRAESDEMALSHEFLAMMLGRRRAGVTVAIGALKKAGLVTTSHGHIRITDRRGLEATACECYRMVRDEYRRLLP